MAISMFQQHQQSKMENDESDGKQITNRTFMNIETFIALFLQVFALQKDKKNNIFLEHPV